MFTTIQGAAITIVGDQLLSLDVRGLALSIIAFLVAVIGLNNERNLNSHLIGFRQRAIELEDEHGASLVRAGMDQAKKTPGLMLTHSTFRAYYVLLVIGWVVIWILNI